MVEIVRREFGCNARDGIARLAPSAMLSLAVHGLKLLMMLHFFTAGRCRSTLEAERVHVAVRTDTGVSSSGSTQSTKPVIMRRHLNASHVPPMSCRRSSTT